MLCLPLIIADKVLRVVVKPFATSSMVRRLPVSSRKPSIVSRISSPGWAGSNIVIIVILHLMIIQIIDVLYVNAVKPEDNPVILVHFHRPKSNQIPSQLMQAIPGDI